MDAVAQEVLSSDNVDLTELMSNESCKMNHKPNKTSIKKAWFTKKLKHVIIEDKSDSLELVTEVNRVDINVIWLKNGVIIPTNTMKFNIIKEKTICKLMINEITKDDDAVYTCDCGDERTVGVVSVVNPKIARKEKTKSRVRKGDNKEQKLEVLQDIELIGFDLEEVKKQNLMPRECKVLLERIEWRNISDTKGDNNRDNVNSVVSFNDCAADKTLKKGKDKFEVVNKCDDSTTSINILKKDDVITKKILAVESLVDARSLPRIPKKTKNSI